MKSRFEKTSRCICIFWNAHYFKLIQRKAMHMQHAMSHSKWPPLPPFYQHQWIKLSNDALRISSNLKSNLKRIKLVFSLKLLETDVLRTLFRCKCFQAIPKLWKSIFFSKCTSRTKDSRCYRFSFASTLTCKRCREMDEKCGREPPASHGVLCMGRKESDVLISSKNPPPCARWFTPRLEKKKRPTASLSKYSRHF